MCYIHRWEDPPGLPASYYFGAGSEPPPPPRPRGRRYSIAGEYTPPVPGAPGGPDDGSRPVSMSIKRRVSLLMNNVVRFPADGPGAPAAGPRAGMPFSSLSNSTASSTPNTGGTGGYGTPGSGAWTPQFAGPAPVEASGASATPGGSNNTSGSRPGSRPGSRKSVGMAIRAAALAEAAAAMAALANGPPAGLSSPGGQSGSTPFYSPASSSAEFASMGEGDPMGPGPAFTVRSPFAAVQAALGAASGSRTARSTESRGASRSPIYRMSSDDAGYGSGTSSPFTVVGSGAAAAAATGAAAVPHPPPLVDGVPVELTTLRSSAQSGAARSLRFALDAGGSGSSSASPAPSATVSRRSSVSFEVRPPARSARPQRPTFLDRSLRLPSEDGQSTGRGPETNRLGGRRSLEVPSSSMPHAGGGAERSHSASPSIAIQRAMAEARARVARGEGGTGSSASDGSAGEEEGGSPPPPQLQGQGQGARLHVPRIPGLTAPLINVVPNTPGGSVNNSLKTPHGPPDGVSLRDELRRLHEADLQASTKHILARQASSSGPSSTREDRSGAGRINPLHRRLSNAAEYPPTGPGAFGPPEAASLQPSPRRRGSVELHTKPLVFEGDPTTLRGVPAHLSADTVAAGLPGAPEPPSAPGALSLGPYADPSPPARALAPPQQQQHPQQQQSGSLSLGPFESPRRSPARGVSPARQEVKVFTIGPAAAAPLTVAGIGRPAAPAAPRGGRVQLPHTQSQPTVETSAAAAAGRPGKLPHAQSQPSQLVPRGPRPAGHHRPPRHARRFAARGPHVAAAAGGGVATRRVLGQTKSH
eukprot:tig00000455_g1055.t1